jgi:hypothetical protein
MTATQARSGVSLEELQAAYEAARRGQFATIRRGEFVPSAARVEADPDRPIDRAPFDRWLPAGQVVAVFAAHAGAGASTVAVAVADALSERGLPVRLVELCDPARSGLAAATNAELGEDGSGWRRGRRGAVTLDRLVERSRAVADMPAPRALEDGPSEVLVLDVGWPARDAYAVGGWLAAALQDATVLLVCRPTVPGIRQAEHLAAEMASHSRRPVVLAAVGPARWPGAVTASAGAELRAARAERRLVTVPANRRLEVDGITADPLPNPIKAAGRALVAALPAPPTRDQSASGRAGRVTGRNGT